MPENNDSFRLGRLEDKFAIHEPMLINLHGLVSISDEIKKINAELQTLRDSKIAMKEKMIALLNEQEKSYQNIIKLCAEKSELVQNCPIKNAMTRISALEGNMSGLDKTVDRLKMTGWDIILRAIPWLLLFSVTLWIAMKG